VGRQQASATSFRQTSPSIAYAFRLPAELMNKMLRVMIAIAALTVQSTTCAFSPTVNIDCASRTSLYATTIAKKGCAAVPFEKKKVQSCNN
jgi:hypothetical protein